MMPAVFLCLLIAGALGATVASAIGAQPILLGGCAAAAFIGLAGAAASTAAALDLPGNLKEPREARGPTNPQWTAEEKMTRSVFGKLWFAAIGAFVVLGFVPLISLARKPGRHVRTGWKPGMRVVTEQNVPITADYLVPGGIATVFPENGVDIPEASALLIRVDAAEIATVPPDRASWSPQGYLAYSKICTHAGCPVALYRHASHQLYCPCHQSEFDVLAAGKNISGPAPRPLPQLPLAIDAHGYLIATADFQGPVGPDDWERTV